MNTDDQQLFQQAQAAFNSLKLMKGQITNIATCDNQGNPNVAPVGTMRIVDQDTVHVLQGLLPRTIQNLESNPRAAFSVTMPMTLRSFASMLFSRDEAPVGYRVYCELTGIDDDKAAVQREAQAIVGRVPRLFRAAFGRFCDQNLKRLLKFRILSVRAT
jgi:hypothetical protein